MSIGVNVRAYFSRAGFVLAWLFCAGAAVARAAKNALPSLGKKVKNDGKPRPYPISVHVACIFRC
jgi:hypothetical protein